MSSSKYLLFFIINFSHLFWGYRYFSIFLKYSVKRRYLFIFAWGMLFVLLNLLSYYMIFGSDSLQIFCSFIIGSILSASTVIFHFYDRKQAETESKLKELFFQQQLQYYEKQYQEIFKQQNETRIMRHELKNNFILLEALADKGDIQGIQEAIQQMYHLKENHILAHTGNMIVDAVLNYKISSASPDNIKFELDLNIPTKLDINDVRFCGVLGNAIENAMEACLHVPIAQRTITVFMQVQKKNLFVEISNPYDGTILTDSKGKLLSRKKNRMNHGLGISVMEELLGNNMGSLETVWDDNFFYLRILFYLVI